MREGLITIPNKDNDGTSLNELIEQTMLLLAKRFGGATAIEAQGSWIANDGKLYREPVTQIVTAYDPADEQADNFIFDTAVMVGLKAKQLAMYVRYASGNVQIIDTSMPEVLAA